MAKGKWLATGPLFRRYSSIVINHGLRWLNPFLDIECLGELHVRTMAQLHFVDLIYRRSLNIKYLESVNWGWERGGICLKLLASGIPRCV